jgi:PhnB protein
MKIIPYLFFNGQCKEALAFYADVLGGKSVGEFTFGASPMAHTVPADWGDKIMHTAIQIGDQSINACDAPPPHYHQPQGFRVCLDLETEADAERIYPLLSEGGKIEMPLQKTFWAKQFAMFDDRYGTKWMINVPQPM